MTLAEINARARELYGDDAEKLRVVITTKWDDVISHDLDSVAFMCKENGTRELYDGQMDREDPQFFVREEVLVFRCSENMGSRKPQW